MIAAYSFYFGCYSWAAHARGFLRALNSLEEVALIPWDVPDDPLQISTEEREMVARGKCYKGDGTAIAIGPIERMTWAQGIRRIGFAVWETTRIPADKVAMMKEMDEIWTPSGWGKDVLAQNGIEPRRIQVVPEGVDTVIFRPTAGARNGRPFRFLSVGKWEARKGVDLLVSAFCEEFRSWEPVELVLHCFNPYVPGFNLMNHIRAAASGPHAAIRASSNLSMAEMVTLYNSSDVFVLPTRAEGWGLPIMEAMACGLPAIVTDYSAPSEYLDDEIAWLIPVEKMVDVYDPLFFPQGSSLGCWAEPDRAQLRGLMRYAFNHPEDARVKGRQARARAVGRWTWYHAAAAARDKCSLQTRDMGFPC